MVELPIKVVLSFSHYDFGCAGVYEQQSEDLFELVNATKARQIVLQKYNVHGPSWVLLDPAHDIHYCLAVTGDGAMPDSRQWLPIGMPSKYLPYFNMRFKQSREKLISELSRLPLKGRLCAQDGAFFLSLADEWEHFLENLPELDIDIPSRLDANDRANQWAEMLDLDPIIIDQFPYHTEMGPHISVDELNAYVGDEVAFEIVEIVEDLVETEIPEARNRLVEIKSGGLQDYPSLWIRVKVKFCDPTVSQLGHAYLTLAGYGLCNVPTKRVESLGRLAIKGGLKIDVNERGSVILREDSGLFSPMTQTSSDEEYQNLVEDDFANLGDPPSPNTGALDFGGSSEDDLSFGDNAGLGALDFDAFGDDDEEANDRADDDADEDDFGLAPPHSPNSGGDIGFDDDEDDFGLDLAPPDYSDEDELMGALDFDDDPDEPERSQGVTDPMKWQTSIEEIGESKEENGQIYYLVTWSDSDPTWETVENCDKFAPAMLDQATGGATNNNRSCAAVDWGAIGEMDFPDSGDEDDFGDRFDEDDISQAEKEENLRLQQQQVMEDDEFDYEDTESVVLSCGSTIHELKSMLRKIDRLQKSQTRGQTITTEQARLISRKAELKKRLDDGKIETQGLQLRAKFKEAMQLDQSVVDFVKETQGDDSDQQPSLLKPKKKPKRRRRDPALPSISE